MLKQIEGDIITLGRRGEFDVIVHGCNCFCVMGAGLAARIKLHFPDAYFADAATRKGDINKLGTISYAKMGHLTVVNAYTQYEYSCAHQTADYTAIASCMRLIKEKFHGQRIGIPKIGCGLAGGNWDIVKAIIEQFMKHEDATIVIYNG